MAKRKAKHHDTPPRPQQRMYGGAQINRLTDGWVTASTSADAEISSSMVRLRNRARQLVRDSDYARQALRTIANNVIGTGIRLQSQVRMQRGGKLDQGINDRIEEEWADWCKADSCHTAGRLTFAEIERLAVASMAESGEVFIRLVRAPFGDSRTPLALEVIEADLLDETKDDYGTRGGGRGGEWRMGVQVDEWGRPINYAFLKRHPGDIRASGGREHMIVPAADVVHLMLCERPGQTRGVSWFASAIKRLHHLAGYEEAEVVRARASSSLMGFVTSPEGELFGEEVLEGERVTSFEPGVFKYLNPGETVSVPTLDAPDGQFEPFLRAMLRAMAAGIGVAYESISRDYSQSNYSSSRLSLLEERENWKALQQMIISNLHRRVYEAWLDAAVTVGELPFPDYQQNRRRYQSARWMPRGWGWVDPTKEVEANKMAVRCGFTTQAQVVAEQGGDLEELLMARKAELDRSNELGIKFETDPADDIQGGAPGMSAQPGKKKVVDTLKGSTSADGGSEPGAGGEATQAV